MAVVDGDVFFFPILTVLTSFKSYNIIQLLISWEGRHIERTQHGQENVNDAISHHNSVPNMLSCRQEIKEFHRVRYLG